MVCPARDHREVTADVTAMLSAARIPVPVAGCLAWDPLSAADLQAGQVPRRRRRAGLMASARAVTEQLFALWPELAAAPAADPAQELPGPPVRPGALDAPASRPPSHYREEERTAL
jgi:hypothetical protein